MNEPKPSSLDALDSGQSITVGRYILHRQIARGGMATIHIARLMGDEGFSRIVAAKRLHPEFAEDGEFVAMFLDEARIASRVQHRNVVPVLDVVTAGHEVILVQEYVHGAPLHTLLRNVRQEQVHMPVPVAVAIACQVLAGLHATHETVDELGEPMHIVHRDVSPQNVMIAVDGSARLLDFGVAKAVMAAHVTREGTYKGKLAYSAPEQLRGAATKQSDIYSLSVLLWELLVGQRMHRTRSGAELVSAVMNGALPSVIEALYAAQAWDSISATERRYLQLLDPIVSRGLAVDTRERWASAAEMEEALAGVVRPAPARAVAAWAKAAGRDFFERRDGLIAAEEASWRKLNGTAAGRNSLLPSQRTSVNVRLPGTDRVVAGPIRSLFSPDASQRGRVLIALASILLVALGVVWALRGAEAPTSAPAAEAASATAESLPGASAPPAAKAADAARPLRVAQEPASEAKPSTERAQLGPAASAAEPPKEARPAQLSRRSVDDARDRPERRSRPAAPARPAPAPEPAADSALPSPASKPASNDCDVPYYFEGSKKIFKPACI